MNTTTLVIIMVSNALTSLMNDTYLMKITREQMVKEQTGPNPARDVAQGYTYTDDDVRRRILETAHDLSVEVAEELPRDTTDEVESVVADSAYDQPDEDDSDKVIRASLAFMSDGHILQWFEDILERQNAADGLSDAELPDPDPGEDGPSEYRHRGAREL